MNHTLRDQVRQKLGGQELGESSGRSDVSGGVSKVSECGGWVAGLLGQVGRLGRCFVHPVIRMIGSVAGLDLAIAPTPSPSQSKTFFSGRRNPTGKFETSLIFPAAKPELKSIFSLILAWVLQKFSSTDRVSDRQGYLKIAVNIYKYR